MKDKPKPPLTRKATVDALRYIASSPSSECGGFHENTILTARAALYWLAERRKEAV